MRIKLIFLVTIVLCLAGFLPARAQDGSPLVLVLTAEGPISSAMAEYVSAASTMPGSRALSCWCCSSTRPAGELRS